MKTTSTAPARRPAIGITLGDPSGIGPEIIARTLAATPTDVRERVIVFGDRGVLDRTGVPLAPEVAIEDITSLSVDDSRPGAGTLAGAVAQIEYLEVAARAAHAGRIDALVTAPISKIQARLAGFQFPGHTEFFASRLGATEFAMMFAGPRFRVVLATIHIPLAKVAEHLTAASIARAIALGAVAINRDFSIAKPRIGVLGLNPHAGENGLFGREEPEIIVPGIIAGKQRVARQSFKQESSKESIPASARTFDKAFDKASDRTNDLEQTIDATVEGPLIPDAAFRSAYEGQWDLLIAMYHDQGLIPIKLVDFEESVNVTLGLPIVRTSPDHGVAYDIAGAGRARITSFAAALKTADAMAARRLSSAG
ncbi:MAG: 4-hydroxythreonine-4-phosphate dehydrogenase PdxA [Pseudomonadota bacterium]